MKNNQPVTNVEKPFLGDKPLVSKTNLKGIITYASDSFVAQCGFSRDELIGHNHNLIRHPDMPPEAFRQMWETIQGGHPWRGTVKNRHKDGSYYWVDAFVVPIYQDGRITGYMSARTKPSREQIAAAEGLYADMNAGRTPPAPNRFAALLNSLRGRLAVLVAMVAILICGGTAVSLWIITQTNRELEDSYYTRLEPARMIGRIMLLMSDNRAQAMLAIEHRPGGVGPEEHGPLQDHLATLELNREEITTLLSSAKALPFTDHERELADSFVTARNRYVSEGLNRVLGSIRAGDFDGAERYLLHDVHPLYLEANRKADALLNQILQSARLERELAGERYRNWRLLSLTTMALGVLLAIVIGLTIARQLMVRIGHVRSIFEQMAQGRLTNEIDLSIQDEMGALMASLAATQVHLRVMIDEITWASDTVEERVKAVNDRVYDVAEHSEEQQDAVNEAVGAIGERVSDTSRLAQQTEEATRLMTELQDGLSQSRGAHERMSASIERVQSALEEGSTASAQRNLQDTMAEAFALQAQFDSLARLGQEANLAAAAIGSEIRLHVFANEEVADQMKRISELISDNRQAVHDTWQYAQDLKRTAEELKTLVSYFE